MPRAKMTTIEAHQKGRHPYYARRKTCPLCREDELNFAKWQLKAISDGTICKSCYRRHGMGGSYPNICETCLST